MNKIVFNRTINFKFVVQNNCSYLIKHKFLSVNYAEYTYQADLLHESLKISTNTEKYSGNEIK